MPIALANAGVPMFLVLGPVFVIAIVPIIVIEALMLRSSLRVEWKSALSGATSANVFSSFVGVPITYIVLLVIQIASAGIAPRQRGALDVTLNAPWVIPYAVDLHWMIPAAAAYLCIPFFIVSWLCERYVLFRRFPSLDRVRVSRAAFGANSVTYGMMASFWLLIMHASL